MARRYQQEELLHLRQSPLCVKPKDLPPVEEWIGQTLDELKSKRLQGNVHTTGANARALREGQGQTNGAAGSRPSALDFSGRQHGRQTSNGDLSLKGMFSPGLRDGNKSYDSSTRSGFFGPLSPRGEQSTGMGRFGLAEREQPQGRENRATTRFSALRTSKDEGDSWIGGKATRKQDGEDGERGLGRRGERERDQEATRENGRDHRRYGSETVNENIRNRDWRAGDKPSGRVTSKDWNGGLEQDPEWMAEEKPAVEEKKNAGKTVEDFEAWKKSMRAQAAAAKGESGPVLDPQESLPQAPAPAPKKTIEAPLAVDATEDRFFGLFGDAPRAQEAISQAPGQSIQQPATASKGGRSKFTNFFAAPEPQQIPQIQQQPPPVEQAVPTPPQSVPGFKAPTNNKDEEGFQRILNMLKAKSPAAPQGNAAFQAPPRHRTPPLEATSTSATPPLVSPRPKPHGVQNFLNPQSPGGNPDSQFLLNLMKSKDPEPPQSSFATQYGSPLGQLPSYSQPRQQPPQAHYNQHFDRNLEERFHNEFPPGVDKLNPSAHLHNQTRHGRMDSRGYDELPTHHQQQHGPLFGIPPGYHPGMNAPNFPPGLGPMPGQSFDPRDHRAPRGPMNAPPGFGVQGPGGPGGPGGPFRGGMDFPPGFPNMGALNLRDDHGPGPGPGPAPPGFGPPVGGMTRPPPGFRGGPMQMPLDYDGRREEQRLYGGREQ